MDSEGCAEEGAVFWCQAHSTGWSWTLETNHVVIARSPQNFPTDVECQRSIDEVRRYACKAEVDEVPLLTTE